MLCLIKIGVKISMNNKNDFDNEFKELAKQDKMPISSIENLMIKNIENYKNELLTHTEKLLLKDVSEMDLITKKKISGMIKELDLKISEKEKLNLR